MSTAFTPSDLTRLYLEAGRPGRYATVTELAHIARVRGLVTHVGDVFDAAQAYRKEVPSAFVDTWTITIGG